MARQSLLGIGFEERNFQTGELGNTHFVPAIHLSIRQASSVAFKSVFSKARLILVNDDSFLGYLEGEYVALECTVDSLPFEGASPRPPSRPFVVLFQNAQRWREAEIHVSLPETCTNAATRKYFTSCGFCSARLRKANALFNVFTVQGDRDVLRTIYDRVREDLRHLAEGVPVRLKFERSAGYYLSPGFTWLPMQAYSILDHNGDDLNEP